MVFPSEIDKENGRKALEAHPDVKNNNMTVRLTVMLLFLTV